MTDVFEDIEALPMGCPIEYINGVERKDEHLLQPHIDLVNEVFEKIKSGERVYLGITTGERKGSIAYVHGFDGDYENSPVHMHYYNDYRGYGPGRITIARPMHDFLCVILGWDKRRNKIKWTTGRDTVYLPNYQGPTVWAKVDKKAEAAQILEDNPVEDREGNLLEVGDRVVYINARYGAGARLDRGVISKIKANLQVHGDRKYVTFHVIIDNDDGEQSDIREPQLSILKTMSPMEMASKQVLDF